MNITPDEARTALNDIEYGTAKARNTYNMWSYQMVLWGAIWTIGFLATQVQPQLNNWIWGIMLFVGIAGSTILGITQGRSTRLVPGSRAAFVGSRLGMFYGVLYGFAVLWLIVFPFTSLQTGLFWVTIVMFGSIVAGIWLNQAVSVGLYVGITLVTVLGYFLFPHYFWMWAAVFAGLPLVGMGIYYLRKSY